MAGVPCGTACAAEGRTFPFPDNPFAAERKAQEIDCPSGEGIPESAGDTEATLPDAGESIREVLVVDD